MEYTLSNSVYDLYAESAAYEVSGRPTQTLEIAPQKLPNSKMFNEYKEDFPFDSLKPSICWDACHESFHGFLYVLNLAHMRLRSGTLFKHNVWCVCVCASDSFKYLLHSLRNWHSSSQASCTFPQTKQPNMSGQCIRCIHPDHFCRQQTSIWFTYR